MTTAAYATRAPRAGPERLARIVEDGFGIAVAQAQPLASERDLTARVAAADGRAFVLKLANAADEIGPLAFENRALQHVRAVDPALPVPVVVAAPDGRTEVEVDLDGHVHVARLQTFLEGVPAHLARPSPAQRRAFGRALARLSRALRDFRHPAEDRAVLWDMARIGALMPYTVHIDDPEKRERARDAIRRYVERAAPLVRGLRAQVVHNDFHFHNVLVDRADHDAVGGIIDFGDIVRTPLVHDVAIALSFQLPDDGPPLAYAAEFLSAYQDEYPLSAEEVDLLVDLIDARNATTVTISEWRAKLYPDNAGYILRNNPRASLGLARLAAVPRDEARQALRAACGC